ncbi:MAG: hypothetical protein WDO56_21875 [Gammaproteobacteria bacterium]
MFDLGIIGVTLFVSILASIQRTVFRSIPMADEKTRPHLLAFMFGMLSLAVSIVFADLFDPWSYIWLYCGIVLRMAVLVQKGANEQAMDQPIAHPMDQPLRVAQVAAPASREGRSASAVCSRGVRTDGARDELRPNDSRRHGPEPARLLGAASAGRPMVRHAVRAQRPDRNHAHADVYRACGNRRRRNGVALLGSGRDRPARRRRNDGDAHHAHRA